MAPFPEQVPYHILLVSKWDVQRFFRNLLLPKNNQPKKIPAKETHFGVWGFAPYKDVLHSVTEMTNAFDGPTSGLDADQKRIRE